MATQQEIAQNYKELFGRSPDPEGAAYWASTGLSGNALKQAMIGGASFDDKSYYVANQPQNIPSLIDPSEGISPYVSDTFQGQPSAPGSSFSKGLAATNVGQGIPTATALPSSGAATPTSGANAQEIAQNYQRLFGRAADQQGAAYWASTGLTGDALKNAMLSGAQGSDLTYYNTYKNQINALPSGATQATQTGQTPSFTFNFGNPSVGTTSTASGLDTSNPYVQAAEKTVAGNIAGAQAATAANRVNQFTPYGSLQYQQTGTDAQGNPIWSATQSLAPELQGAFGNIAGQVTQNTAQGFNPNLPSVGINPGETYEAAIMRRLQPQQERQAKALEAQLANQGIMPGSEAYTRAKTELAQAQNDQLTSAVVGGFQTGLAANQSAYNQALSNYQLPLATMNQFKAATTPSYVNPYQQAAVSGPDYLGAYTTGQNAQLAQQAAQNAASSGMTSGLFNLAGTAIANPSAVSSAYNWAKGLFS